MRSPGPEDDPREQDQRDGAGAGSAPGEDPSGPAGSGKGKRKKGSFWRELPILVVTALVLTVLLQAFVARVFVIPSRSMWDTLHGCPTCTNDRILVGKIGYLFTDPEPGDVIVFRGPDTWMRNANVPEGTDNPVAGFFQEVGSLLGFAQPGEKDFVKRVIATEGQTVACCDEKNRVTVNGEPLYEPYIYWAPGTPHKQQEFGPVTVPENHLWVMGDNRNNSADSRFQGGGGVDGAVPVQNVIGEAQFIVLPPRRWQSIPEPNPQEISPGTAHASAGPSGPGVPEAPGVPDGLGSLVAVSGLWLGRRGFSTTSPLRAQEHQRT